MKAKIILLAATAMCSTAVPAHAQDALSETSAQAQLEGSGDDIVVTASRTATAVSEVPGSISVISGERLDSQLTISNDLNDVIGKLSPGLAANNELGLSASTGPIVRGRPASVLINGVPVNQLLRSSGFDLGLIDPSSIDRIEVNRGASAVFGFGASGGVINLLTRRGKTASPEVVTNIATSFNPTDIGSSISARAYLGIGADTGVVDYYIGGGYQRNRPEFDARGRNTASEDVDVFNVDTNIGIALGETSELRLTGNFFRRNFRQQYLNPGYTFGFCNAACDEFLLPAGFTPGDYQTAVRQPHAEVADQFQQNAILTASYLNSSFLGQALDLTVFFQQNKLFYVQTYSDAEPVPTLSNFTSPMTNERIGLRSSLTAQIPLGAPDPLEVTYGFDYIKDSMIRTSEFGGTILKPVLYNPGINPLYRTGGANRPISPPVFLEGYAGFVQAKAKLGNIVLTGGVRHEEARPGAKEFVVDDLFGPGRDLIYRGGDMQPFDATLFNGGIVWSVTPSTELYAGVAQGVEIAELGRAYVGSAQDGAPGDPSLIDAEAAITTQYEVGFRVRSGRLAATGAAFFTRAPLSAQTIPDPDPACQAPGATPCPVINLRREEEIWGVEGTLDFAASDRVNMGAVLSWLNGRGRDQSDPTRTWKRLTTDRVSPTRLTAYVGFRPTDTVGFRVQGTQSFRRGGFAKDFAFEPFGNYTTSETNVTGFFLLDASVDFKVLDGELSISAENLLDKLYVPPLIQVYNDLYDGTYAEGTRVTVAFRRTF